MGQGRWIVVVLGAFAAGACATASPRPPPPGLGRLDIDASPSADHVRVTAARATPEDEPRVAAGTPATFELPPGRYQVELDRGGGRYAYDLTVDVRAYQRQQLAVELRASQAERVEPLVYAGVGAVWAGALAGVCASHSHSQACIGSLGAAAVTTVVVGTAWYAWTHRGRIVSAESEQYAQPAPPLPPPPAVRPSTPAPKPAAPPAKKKAP